MSSRVIDAHTHLYSDEMTPHYWVDAMADYGSSISGRSSQYMRERIVQEWFDPAGDLLVEDMDAAGIEKSVVFVLDFALHAGVGDGVSLERRYELFSQAVARHSDRLVLYGGVDPRRPDAAAFVERAAKEYGIKGVKIWPPAGALPNEAYCYRVYERCAQLGLPVVVNTAKEIGPLRSK
jgi:predicted TIM-barrel fold metal-dependent hydrolase